MSQNLGTIYAELGLDTKKMHKGFRDAGRTIKSETSKIERTMKKVSSNMTKIGVGMTAAITAPLVMLSKKMFEAAADAEQVQSKYEIIFGDLTESADKFVNRLGAMGWDEIGIKDNLSEFQDFLVPMGLAEEQALETSKAMTQLALDVGSMKNMSTEEVMTAIRAGLRGETEGASRVLGSNLKVARLEREALEREIIKTGEAMTEEQKIMLRSILMIEDTRKAHNNFKNTAHETANQIKILKQQWAEFKRVYGQPVKNAFHPLVVAAKDLLIWLNGLDEQTKTWIVRIGALAIAIGPVVLVLGQFINALLLIKGAMTAVAGSAVIGKLIAGLGALVSAGFVPVTIAVGGTIAIFKDFIGIRSALWEFIKGFTKLLIDMIDFLWEVIKGIENLLTFNLDGFKENFKEMGKISERGLTNIKNTTSKIGKEIKDGWNRDMNGMKAPGENISGGKFGLTDFNNLISPETDNSGIFDYQSKINEFQKGATGLTGSASEETEEILKNTTDTANQMFSNLNSGLGTATESLKTKAQTIQETFQNIKTSMVDSLTQGMTSIIDGTKTAGDAIRSTFLGIIDSLKNMIIKFIAQKAVTTFLNFLAPGVGSIAGALFGGIFHNGGQVPGYTNQDVPIIAQAGEFVLQPEQLNSLLAQAGSVNNNQNQYTINVGDINNYGDEKVSDQIFDEIMRKLRMNEMSTGRLV
jgi:hypothetical protein